MIFVNNEPLDVKPGKIVAGLEPEKTNNMFIAMHKAASSNHNFEAIAVKLSGGTAEPEPEKQQPQPEKKPKKEKAEKPKKEEPKEKPQPQPVPEKHKEKEEPKVHESKSQPEKEREESHHQPQPQVEQNTPQEDGDDSLRPTTAKTKPARKKKGDNFDKIMVEEKTLPQGIIMDNEEDEQEEKNTSFDQNVVANKNINADLINKKQHGYMVRDILENQGEGEEQHQAAVTTSDKPKKEENKIRMGRIGTKKKEEKNQGGAGMNNNAVAEQHTTITVESIEDVEALRKAIQNLCQYTNPLGRLMEQFVEDVPNLEKEYD